MLQVIKIDFKDIEMNPSMEPGTSVAAEDPAQKKRRLFNNKWLEDPLFKDWLQASPDRDKAFCSVCTTVLVCKRSGLLVHGKSQNHIDNYKCFNKTLSSAPVDVSSASKKVNKEIRTKTAKREFSALFAKHDVPISVVDHLIPLLDRLFYDSEAEETEKIVIPRKKCTKTIIDVLGTAETLELADNLRNSKFSVMIDECTTIANEKLLCVLIKVMRSDRKISTHCFDVIELDQKNYSASTLFTAFKSVFEKRNIPLSNIISFASVMIEERNSFVTSLKEINPNLVVLNCVCHSSALIASKACAQLPEVIYQFLNSVSLYFSSSPITMGDLEDFQTYFGVEVQQILKASPTRWLSLHQCIVRLLQNWIPLIHFFNLQSIENQTSSAIDIYNNFNDHEIHAYLLFLKFTLESFDKFNALFQSQEVQIHILAERSRLILEQMAMCFLKPNALDNITVYSITPDNILPLLSINVGDECQKFLDNCHSEIVEKVKINCLEFYKIATLQIINRLPYSDKFLSDLKFLNSEIALSEEVRLKFNKLDALCEKFDLMHLVSLINNEWVYLPFFLEDVQKLHLSSLTLENMWSEIFKFTHSNGIPAFSNLQKLVDLVLILPHSNAEAERASSNLTDIVTEF